MINHVVLFKFKPDTPEDRIESLYKNISGLEKKIYGIESVTFGKNNNPENKNHGFSHGFIMQFKDEECRDIYLWHPEHKWVAENYVRPIAEDVLAFDYEVK